MNESLTDTGDDPAALQASIGERLKASFETELANREARNQQYAVDDLDTPPFVVTADISDCPERSPRTSPRPNAGSKRLRRPGLVVSLIG